MHRCVYLYMPLNKHAIIFHYEIVLCYLSIMKPPAAFDYPFGLFISVIQVVALNLKSDNSDLFTIKKIFLVDK